MSSPANSPLKCSSFSPQRNLSPVHSNWTIHCAQSHVVFDRLFTYMTFSLYPLGVAPLPVTVTTRIITFLVGDSYKPSFCHCYWEGATPNVSMPSIYDLKVCFTTNAADLILEELQD